MREFTPLWLALIVTAALGSAYGKAVPDYHLRVKVDPARHTLEAEARIEGPPAGRFYLHKGLTVRQVTADGKAARFTRGDGDDGPLYAALGVPVTVEAAPRRELVVQYDGAIEDTPFNCNGVGPELVELALYAAWYPLFPGFGDCTFTLEVDLPSGWAITTNGKREGTHERGGRTLTQWRSYAPGFDIALVASPELHQLVGGDKATRVEAYVAHLPAQPTLARTEALAAAIHWLSARYGPPPVKGVLTLVYSPREGQGYSRLPLVVISERRAQEDLHEAQGEARRFRDECHEVAHFWWMVADPQTTDDWINEGLAELCAFRVAEAKYGRAFADARLQEYREHAAQSQTTDAIAETEQSSPDREVNRYDKATLMFLQARERFGEASLDGALRAVYARFGGTRRATTADFLREVRAHMGADAEAFFRDALYHKGTLTRPSQ